MFIGLCNQSKRKEQQEHRIKNKVRERNVKERGGEGEFEEGRRGGNCLRDRNKDRHGNKGKMEARDRKRKEGNKEKAIHEQNQRSQ